LAKVTQVSDVAHGPLVKSKQTDEKQFDVTGFLTVFFKSQHYANVMIVMSI
jgi:hypothetical protein